jgi:hypothetical protein
MALSDAAAREIAKVLRNHVGVQALDSIERLIHALRMVSDR